MMVVAVMMMLPGTIGIIAIRLPFGFDDGRGINRGGIHGRGDGRGGVRRSDHQGSEGEEEWEFHGLGYIDITPGAEQELRWAK